MSFLISKNWNSQVTHWVVTYRLAILFQFYLKASSRLTLVHNKPYTILSLFYFILQGPLFQGLIGIRL